MINGLKDLYLHDCAGLDKWHRTIIMLHAWIKELWR